MKLGPNVNMNFNNVSSKFLSNFWRQYGGKVIHDNASNGLDFCISVFRNSSVGNISSEHTSTPSPSLIRNGYPINIGSQATNEHLPFTVTSLSMTTSLLLKEVLLQFTVVEEASRARRIYCTDRGHPVLTP